MTQHTPRMLTVPRVPDGDMVRAGAEYLAVDTPLGFTDIARGVWAVMAAAFDTPDEAEQPASRVTDADVERVARAMYEASTNDGSGWEQNPLQDHVRKLARAAIAAYEASGAAERSGWRPIETAPKDGAPVDLWCVHPKHRPSRSTEMEWRSGEWRKSGPIPCDLNPDWEPTHWRPLPDPPTTEPPTRPQNDDDGDDLRDDGCLECGGRGFVTPEDDAGPTGPDKVCPRCKGGGTDPELRRQPTEPPTMRVSGAQGSDYLAKPVRSATEAALDRAVTALRDIARARLMGTYTQEVAFKTVEDIEALIGSKKGGPK